MAQDRHSLGLHLQQTPAKWRFPGEKRAARCRKTRQTTQTTGVPAQTHASSLAWAQAATPVPTGTWGPAYPRGAAKTRAWALFSAAPLELPCMFCCNSAITQPLLIGIRRFLVETWAEFQGGSDGQLKTTPKPQENPLFRVFRFFCAQYGPRPALPRPTFKPNPSQIEISG